MEAYSYAQTSPISVDNFHFQKAPLPSSFTRFAHKNFFSTEIIHTHVDFCSFRIQFPFLALLSPTTTTTNPKHPAWLSQEKPCGVFNIHLSFQLIRLKSVLQSGSRSLTAACLRGSRRFPHRFPLPVHTGFCADRRCSLRLRRSFP